METVPKNQHRHSERSEESHTFSFQVKKSKKRSFGLTVLRMTQKGKFTKILEQPQVFMKRDWKEYNKQL
jgi:hypothetical protein